MIKCNTDDAIIFQSSLDKQTHCTIEVSHHDEEIGVEIVCEVEAFRFDVGFWKHIKTTCVAALITWRGNKMAFDKQPQAVNEWWDEEINEACEKAYQMELESVEELYGTIG